MYKIIWQNIDLEIREVECVNSGYALSFINTVQSAGLPAYIELDGSVWQRNVYADDWFVNAVKEIRANKALEALLEEARKQEHAEDYVLCYKWYEHDIESWQVKMDCFETKAEAYQQFLCIKNLNRPVYCTFHREIIWQYIPEVQPAAVDAPEEPAVIPDDMIPPEAEDIPDIDIASVFGTQEQSAPQQAVSVVYKVAYLTPAGEKRVKEYSDRIQACSDYSVIAAKGRPVYAMKNGVIVARTNC